MHHAIQKLKDFSVCQKEKARSSQISGRREMHLNKNSSTSKSTLAVSWLPMPLDQNWEMTSSNVWLLTTLKEKLLAAEKENLQKSPISKVFAVGTAGHRKMSTRLAIIWKNFKPQVIPEQHPHKIFVLCQNLMFSLLLRPKMHHAALLCISFLYGLVNQKI